MSTQTGRVPAGPATDDLTEALAAVARVLDGFRFRLPSPGAAERERERAELVRSIREYLLPRLADRDAPLVAGFFGAGGAGKSVIVNSLARQRVGLPGPVRPTTRAAVIWAHREHAARYWREFLIQVRERVGPAVESILGDDPLTRNLTLIDTPAFDVVSAEGRRIAYEVLAVADLCVFVASGLRYADSASWDFLRLAQRRGLPILFVLNRLSGGPEERNAVIEDYATRLADGGLLLDADPALIFPVSEQAIEPHGGVASSAIGGLRRELEELTDREFRNVVASQAARGAVMDLTDRIKPLADALVAEGATVGGLLEPVDSAYGAADAALAGALADGRVDAGDVGARSRVARIVTHLAGTAAQEAAAAWDEHPVGRLLLESEGRSLWRHGPEAHADVEQAMANWESTVADLAVERAGRWWGRRSTLRRLAVSTALHADRPVPARLSKALTEDGAQVLMRWSRRTLIGDLGEVLLKDGSRFRVAAGDAASLHSAGEHLAAGLDRLAGAAEAAS